MKKIYFASLLVLTLSLSISAQNPRLKKVDEFVEKTMQKQKIPGVAVAIVEDGKISYAKGYGLANIEHQVPVKVDTIFQLGSVGKQFTSAAIMLLAQDGKINIDDKISKYFKDTPAAWKDITVRHLLTHTSGLGDYPNDFKYWQNYTEAELFEIIKKSKLEFKTGDKWRYSNFGYVTLGILVRQVSGKFYGDFLQERVFKPLEMKTARVINEADIIPNRAAGYRLVKGEIKNQEWVAPSLNTTADGAMYMTLKDLAKWDRALYGEKLFKKSTFEQMWTPVKLNNGKTHPYGFGWKVGKVKGGRVVSHGGSWQGFKAYISRFIDEKTTVIVFANASQANPRKIAAGVAKAYNPKLAPIPEKAIADKEPKLTAFLKGVLQKVLDGTVEKDVFTD